MLLLLKTLKTLRSKFKLLSYFKLKLKFKYEELNVLVYLSNFTSNFTFLTSSHIAFAVS